MINPKMAKPAPAGESKTKSFHTHFGTSFVLVPPKKEAFPYLSEIQDPLSSEFCRYNAAFDSWKLLNVVTHSVIDQLDPDRITINFYHELSDPDNQLVHVSFEHTNICVDVEDSGDPEKPYAVYFGERTADFLGFYKIDTLAELFECILNGRPKD